MLMLLGVLGWGGTLGFQLYAVFTCRVDEEIVVEQWDTSLVV